MTSSHGPSGPVSASERQTVLIFHGIGTPRAELPAAEHPYWIGEDFFAEIVELVRDRDGGRGIVLTFDDGNASDLAAAARLQAAGLHGKFYLLTARLGLPHYVDPDGARTLDAIGMEVGLHGHAHVDWRRLSPAQLREETVDARARLADTIGKPVTSVAIPFGAYDRRVHAHLKRQRFDRIYNSDAGPAQASAHVQRRTAIMRHHRIGDVVDLLDDKVGFPQRVRRAIAPIVKRWR